MTSKLHCTLSLKKRMNMKLVWPNSTMTSCTRYLRMTNIDAVDVGLFSSHFFLYRIVWWEEAKKELFFLIEMSGHSHRFQLEFGDEKVGSKMKAQGGVWSSVCFASLQLGPGLCEGRGSGIQSSREKRADSWMMTSKGSQR